MRISQFRRRLPVRTLGALATILFAATFQAQAQQVVPEIPSKWREVTGVIDGVIPSNPYFTRPHYPGIRTTMDGRVGVIVEGNVPRFTLLRPEMMRQPFLRSEPGSYTMSGNTWHHLDGMSLTLSRAQFVTYPPNHTGPFTYPSHACLWDDQPPFSDKHGHDVYDIKVFVSANHNDNGTRYTQFFVTPIRVRVANPKTDTAEIVSIEKTGPTIAGDPFVDHSSGFEPVIAGDGRLLIIRIGSPSWNWYDPNTRVAQPANKVDVVYAYYERGETADPRLWNNLIPVTFAPYDQRIHRRFGFARYPFRDSAGAALRPGSDIRGSYPWIDRDAKNLFLEMGGDRFHWKVGATDWSNARYPYVTVPGDVTATYRYQGQGENGGHHQCISLVGLWTHGKIVQIDNLNNDMDYAVGNGRVTLSSPPIPQQRLVQLYQAGSDPTGQNPSGYLRLGYGRASRLMPPMENDNGNIIESFENKLNYRKEVRSIATRDVVWLLNNGKQVDELIFDDYMDPDAFIIAEMTGLLTHHEPSGPFPVTAVITHHSGWNQGSKTFSDDVKLQNAASSPGKWKVPAHGLVVNHSSQRGRLEPAANGGVRGKGFWMDGTIGLEWDVDAQSSAGQVATHDWYVGIFVDRRYPDDSNVRDLLTFPDGTSIRLYGARQLHYVDAAGKTQARIALPLDDANAPQTELDSFFPHGAWAHFAFQIFEAGKRIDFHLDGLIYHRFEHDSPLFAMSAGTMTVGKVAGPRDGFAGWIDEFKVFAHSVDLETACNHAGGTLIGLENGYSGKWRAKFASRYPQWAQDEIREVLANEGELPPNVDAFANYHDHRSDNATSLLDVPSATKSLRDAALFPEGPLFHNAPRPDSRANRFCLSCHHAGGLDGLSLDALSFDSSLTATMDPRRQPSQPPAKLYGFIPTGLVNCTSQATAQPTSSLNLRTASLDVDPLMLPTWSGTTNVMSVSLVDGATGRVLDRVENNAEIDPARYFATSFGLRANLDSAQGSVTLAWNSTSYPAVPVPPYALANIALTPGAHTLAITPQHGTTTTFNLTVPSGRRAVAQYQNDFRPTSPAPGWRYAWNKDGDVMTPSSYRSLAWNGSRYVSEGLSWPDAAPGRYVSLRSVGGHPGPDAGQFGSGVDHFVLAGFQVRKTQKYWIHNGSVGDSSNNGGDGGEVRVLVRELSGNVRQIASPLLYGAGGSVSLSNVDCGTVHAGETIFVAVGPRGGDTSDGFDLDFDIEIDQ